MPDLQLQGPPPHFIVFVPGYMGSKLRDKKTGEIVWLDVPGLLGNPLRIDSLIRKMVYPNPDLEPAGIMDELLIALPWIKQEHYGRLLVKFKKWGYQIDPPDPQPGDLAAYTFAYDWRQDNRLSGKLLGQAIEGWRARHAGAKVWLITHSNGGIVARWYIQQEGGREHVGKLLHMASPWDGTPKAVPMLTEGLDVLGLKKLDVFGLGRRMKDVIRSFPSAYQLIPRANPFLRDEDNEVVDPYADTSWLDSDGDREVLADALAFNNALNEASGVETICFYGTRTTTNTAGLASRDDNGKIVSFQWLDTGGGDGTIPTRSAIHPWVDEAHRVRSPASHGDIYVEDSVVSFLRNELIDRYAGQPRRGGGSFLQYDLVFEPDKDFYLPGEEVRVWAQLDSNQGAPIREADVEVQLAFREPLPGSAPVAPPPPTEWVPLLPVPAVPGRFEASLPAPAVEGYYRLPIRVQVGMGPRTDVTEELIIVEA